MNILPADTFILGSKHYARCIKAGKHGRTTKGRIYCCCVKKVKAGDGTDAIRYYGTDDNGVEMWMLIDNSDYYEYATKKEYEAQQQSNPLSHKQEQQMNTEIPNIETVTLIDGDRADSFTPERLLEVIKTNRREYEKLVEMDIDSEYVKQQIDNRMAAEGELIELLDKHNAS